MAKSGPKTTYTRKGSGAGKVAERYTHPEETSPMRPDVGTQPQFRKKKAPRTYRYDSSLAPSLEWDGKNGSREMGEWLLALIERASALREHTFDSYLTYMRDRLLLARDLLAPSGSVFVQISDENLHHVRELAGTDG